MYLRESADGAYAALVTFFRVVVSPHGPGHAAFVLMSPQGGATADRPNVCLTDNEPLARYLREGFVANFGSFRGNPRLDEVEFRSADRFAHEGNHTSSWHEIVTGPGVHCELEWADLYDTFALDVEPARSATGRHRMLSLFVSARSATCRLNGVEAGGQAFPRDAFGRASSTAFLAFSETWISV